MHSDYSSSAVAVERRRLDFGHKKCGLVGYTAASLSPAVCGQLWSAVVSCGQLWSAVVSCGMYLTSFNKL